MSVTTLDIQSIIPHNRHPLVFAVFQSILPGSSFHLVNNHDPAPLHHQMQHHFPNEFTWNYLESGPVWRIEVKREANEEVTEGATCCGGCGCD